MEKLNAYCVLQQQQFIEQQQQHSSARVVNSESLRPFSVAEVGGWNKEVMVEIAISKKN